MKLLRRLSFLFTLLAVCLFSYAQNAVTGKVTDSTGKGIPGVKTVIVKGTTKGTSTKADGSFSINALSNATLVVTGIGYATREIEVNGQSNLTVSLAEKQSELNTVVVTALGITRQTKTSGLCHSERKTGGPYYRGERPEQRTELAAGARLPMR